MAEVLYGSIKYDGKVFEAGSPASKLPKSVREHARNIGVLVDKPPAPKIEPDDEQTPEIELDDEPDDEE